MNDFNIKQFLTENKLTRNSRLLKENTEENYWSEWAAGEIKAGNDTVGVGFGDASSESIDVFNKYVKVVKILNADSKELRGDIAAAVSGILYGSGSFEDYGFSVLTTDQFSQIADILRGEDLDENTLNEGLTYQFSEYDFDVKGNHEFYSKVVEIVKSNSNYPYMTDREIDINIEKTADYHYGEARKANKNSREYPPMTAEEFAQSVIDNMVPNPKYQ